MSWGNLSDDSSVLTKLLNIDQLLIDCTAYESFDVECKLVEYSQFINEHDPMVKSILKRLMSELKNYDPLSKLSVDLLKQELVIHLIRQHNVISSKQENDKKGLSQEQLNKVNAYIESYYAAEITLKDLANLVNLSEYHFARLYKKVTNTTPYQYILSCRFEKAKILLIDTDLTIQQTAFEVGYKDDSAFSKAFTRFFGVSPSAYRKQFKNQICQYV